MATKKSSDTPSVSSALEEATLKGRIGTKPSGEDMSEYTLAGQVAEAKKTETPKA